MCVAFLKLHPKFVTDKSFLAVKLHLAMMFLKSTTQNGSMDICGYNEHKHGFCIVIIKIKVKNYEESLASSPDEDCAGGEERVVTEL